MAIEVYKGIKIPTELTDTINSGTDTPGGIIIDNDKALADRVTDIEDRNLTNWKFGDATPGASLNPEEGDAYFRSDGKVYVYSNNVWSVMTDLKGPQGSSGTNGNSCTAQITSSGGVYTLTITNTDTQGNTSTSTATIYQGSNGVDGQDGQAGQDGQDGATIYCGTVVTGTGSSISAVVSGSKVGDIYINTGTCNFYTASAANTWDYQMCLQGPAGQNGQNGADGAGSGWTNSTDSSSGSVSVTLANGSYFILTSASVSALTITNGFTTIGDIATVEFTSPSTAATYSAPTGTKHYGDDCSGGDFTPTANVTYKIVYEKWNAGLTAYVKARS